MCGRYTLLKLADFLKYFPWIEFPGSDPEPRYNIAPSQQVAAITGESPRIDYLRWGLVPSWAKDGSIAAGSRMINARAETLAEKPAFKRLLKSRRCLIPADGFYEWAQNPGEKTKTPYCFRLNESRPFAFAGLYDRWRSPDGGELCTCTIITTSANALLKSFHNRMPVILKDEHCQKWASPDELTADETAEMLRPYPDERMNSQRVSTLVNSVRNEGPELMAPAAEPPVRAPFQPSLFGSD